MSIIHSKYSASSANRWLSCPASVRMSEGIAEETNDDAELGTHAHELGEFCLKTGLNAFECIGLKFNNITVDSSTAEAVQLYVSYVRDLCRKYNVDPMLEKRVVMHSVSDDVFGTSDCIVIVGDWLFVIDYKHGYDLVNVNDDNKQAIHYAISTLDTFKLWQTINYIVTVIVQPHGDHIDGSIRTKNYVINDMYGFHKMFSNGVAEAKIGTRFKAGEHCKYCPAIATCRARMTHTLDLAYLDKPFDELSIPELEVIYNESKVISKQLEKVSDRMTALARKGSTFDGYKLVNITPRAKCIDEAGFVADAMFISGREKHEFYNTKLKAKGDCTKLVANDHFLIDQYFKRDESSSTTLVPLTDSRPAVSVGKASGLFTAIN